MGDLRLCDVCRISIVCKRSLPRAGTAQCQVFSEILSWPGTVHLNIEPRNADSGDYCKKSASMSLVFTKPNGLSAFRFRSTGSLSMFLVTELTEYGSLRVDLSSSSLAVYMRTPVNFGLVPIWTKILDFRKSARSQSGQKVANRRD